MCLQCNSRLEDPFEFEEGIFEGLQRTAAVEAQLFETYVMERVQLSNYGTDCRNVSSVHPHTTVASLHKILMSTHLGSIMCVCGHKEMQLVVGSRDCILLKHLSFVM